MQTLIYGPEPPKIGFTQYPSGGITFKIENKRAVNFDDKADRITWKDLYPAKYKLYGLDQATSKAHYHQFTQSLAELTETVPEKQFFLGYLAFYENIFTEIDRLWDQSALIPQVWVNWIHYDSKDTNRAKRAQKEPFRVDFMLKDPEISRNLIIIELDGSSHFSSMDIYTQHVKKDRWLRNQGWKVYRITNQEIEEVFGSYHSLLEEVFGLIPF